MAIPPSTKLLGILAINVMTLKFVRDDGYQWLREIANVINEIGKNIIEKHKIPACLPLSRGDKYKKDNKKIVYYQPR